MPDLPTIDTPLPTLMFDAEHAWAWPQPPFARRQAMTSIDTAVQPCRVETPNGAAVDGQLVHFDAEAAVLRFRVGPGGEPLALPFSRFLRLTLTTPWPLARRAPDAPVERVPTAAQERGYRVELIAGGHLTGRTMGYVLQDGGVYLFAPVDDGAAVERVFVPQDACQAVHFGKSAEEQAAERWIATPEALFAAIEAQKRAAIKPLGEALVDLGFITRGALDRAVSVQGSEREKPLGEELVAAGLLDRADLQTALAHKMGYPLVDLSRFPIDEAAARRLSQKSLVEHNALPLIQDGDRLVVAIDDLVRVPQLQALRALAGLKVVPVLASRERIAMALAALPQRLGNDRWADNVPLHLRSLVTTPGGLRSL
jgi:Type II secretion system (T2SS), protein E, N-terminal domain